MSDFGDFSEFTVGSVMGRTWKVMWSKPFAFFGNTLLSLILSIVLVEALREAGVVLDASYNIPVRAPALSLGGYMFVEFILPFLVPAIFQGILSYAIFMLLLNGWASIGEAFKRSAGRVLSLILATIVMTLALRLLFYVPGFIIIELPIRMDVGGIIAVSLIIGFVFVVITITIIKWSVFAPACVIERTGPVASLGRSSELTKGYGGKIFGIFTLMGIVMFVFSAVAHI